MKSIFEKTQKEIEESLLDDHMDSVVPGDEVGAKRAAKIAAAQAADFYRLLGPEEPEQ